MAQVRPVADPGPAALRPCRRLRRAYPPERLYGATQAAANLPGHNGRRAFEEVVTGGDLEAQVHGVAGGGACPDVQVERARGAGRGDSRRGRHQ